MPISQLLFCYKLMSTWNNTSIVLLAKSHYEHPTRLLPKKSEETGFYSHSLKEIAFPNYKTNDSITLNFPRNLIYVLYILVFFNSAPFHDVFWWNKFFLGKPPGEGGLSFEESYFYAISPLYFLIAYRRS